MYNIEAIQRLIAKNGIDATVRILCSDNLPDKIKTELTKCGIFQDNYLCLSLVYSLAK